MHSENPTQKNSLRSLARIEAEALFLFELVSEHQQTIRG